MVTITILVPFLLQNITKYYKIFVHMLCSIIGKLTDIEQGPIQPSFECYTKAKLSWLLLNVRVTLQAQNASKDQSTILELFNQLDASFDQLKTV